MSGFLASEGPVCTPHTTLRVWLRGQTNMERRMPEHGTWPQSPENA